MISAIICTHNPRKDFIDKTLAHLAKQTLPSDEWELLVIDNRSDEHLAPTLNLSWHPHARVIREEALGLTKARICGITNATGDLLVFIDDDNLLAPDYLAEAARLGQEHAMLGAWGGQQIPIFLSPPDEQVRKECIDMLACRTVKQPCWTNMPNRIEATPHGAGMCIRKHVADHYVSVLANDDLRGSLDRTGSMLLGCGDHDMALTACDLGLGVGVFPTLTLQHLIQPERLDMDYLLRLAEGNGFSGAMLEYCRHRRLPQPPPRTLAQRAWFWLRTRRLSRIKRARIAAQIRGTRRAIAALRDIAAN